MKKTIFTLSLMLICIMQIYAEEKERIAVLNLEANNCPEKLANAVSDMLSGRIYDIDVFTIVERDQMKDILAEQEFQMSGCTDESCAVKMGRLLSAKKIVIGSLNKVADYRLEVKIVDVESSKIEANFSARAANLDALEDATITIARKMASHYGKEAWFGEKAYSICVTGVFMTAQGNYADVAGNGYGVNLNLGISHLMVRHSSLLITAGFYSISPSQDSTETIQSIPLSVYAGYSFPILRGFKISPYIGLGIMMQMASIDEDGRDELGNYEYTKKTYYDPMAAVRIEFNYRIMSDVYMVLAPNYQFIFEKSSTLRSGGAELGARLFL